MRAKKVNTFELLARFEALANRFKNTPMKEKDHALKANNKSTFLMQLQTFCEEFIKLSKEAYDNLSNEEREALIVLSKDKSIVITKADKGNAVVIQNRSDYIA